jgi:hypothetical protein
MDKLYSSLQINERTATYLSYALVCLMAVFAIVISVRFGQALLPGWSGGYMVVLGFLVVLETFYTQRIRKNLVLLDPDWSKFYLAEFIVLLLLTKVFQLAWGGATGLSYQIAAMRQDFAANFFNTSYIVSLLALVMIWIVSLSTSALLEVLRVTRSSVQIEEDVGSQTERSTARQQLVDQMLLVGMVMVLMVSLMRSDRTSSWFQLPGTRMEVIIIGVYFTCGLVLLSLTQFSVMQMRWAVNRVPTSLNLARKWALYGGISLILILLVSLLLPTGYAIGLLTLLGYLVGMVMAAFQLLSWLLLVLVMLAVYYLGLLSREPLEPMGIPPAPLPTAIPQSETGGSQLNMLEWTGSIIFWLVMAGVVVYLLVYFFQLRRQVVRRLPRPPFLSTLFGLWRALQVWIFGIGEKVSQTITAGIERLRSAAAPIPRSSWSYTSLRRMTARQRVIFYYLAMLRRAREGGTPRHRSQTPYEFASRLSDVLDAGQNPAGPVVKQDIESMTSQFVEARYSRHAVDRHQVEEVRHSWQRLRHALRRLHTSDGRR